jgi:hypothetical protein
MKVIRREVRVFFRSKGVMDFVIVLAVVVLE